MISVWAGEGISLGGTISEKWIWSETIMID